MRPGGLVEDDFYETTTFSYIGFGVFYPVFFDHWSRLLGTALIEGPIPFDPTDDRPADPLASARVPNRVAYRELHRRMTVLSDGSVPVSELDLFGERTVGSIDQVPVLDLWRSLVQRRRQIHREEGEGCESLRLRTP